MKRWINYLFFTPLKYPNTFHSWILDWCNHLILMKIKAIVSCFISVYEISLSLLYKIAMNVMFKYACLELCNINLALILLKYYFNFLQLWFSEVLSIPAPLIWIRLEGSHHQKDWILSLYVFIFLYICLYQALLMPK